MYPVKTGRVDQINNVVNVDQDKKIQMARKPLTTHEKPGYDYSVDEVSYADFGSMDMSSLGY